VTLLHSLYEYPMSGDVVVNTEQVGAIIAP
jgi:hypothetical protein